jgi:hypothetical protein
MLNAHFHIIDCSYFYILIACQTNAGSQQVLDTELIDQAEARIKP